MKINLVRQILASLILTGCAALCAQAQTGPVPLADADIKSVLQQRIDDEKMGVGIVVGVVDSKGARVVSHGLTDRASGRLVDRDSVFEIGSITKVFTTLILADMVAKGEVKLDDPVAMYLPKSVTVPGRNGRQISLLDLATHRSGLPRMPNNFAPKNAANPYADYTVDQMYAFLSAYTLPRDIGAKAEYSNLGVGLLGHALALRAGMSYDKLLHDRILAPLGMRSTAIALTPSMRERLAIGHHAPDSPVSNWDFPTLAGAGAVRSSVGDMIKFLQASMNPESGPLAAAVAISMSEPLLSAWSSTTRYGSAITHKNGGTGGYCSFIGFDPVQKTGVVVLSNTDVGVDDIGHKVLNREFALLQLVPPKAFVADLERAGYANAVRLYDERKAKDPDFHLREEPLNEWGYAMLGKGRMADAIALLKLAVYLRPSSANTYDSLAEAYEKNGDRQLALENYKRVLEIDPQNVHATAKIKLLGQAPAGGSS